MKEISKDVKLIQQHALQILKFVHKICVENNIRYSLDGGTLLGAIRHKGFIPWDDDIDIFMPRPDYDKFLLVMGQQNNQDFKCLHFGKTENYYYRFAKVVDLNTKVQEADNIDVPELGVFVDVFPFDAIDVENADKIIKKVKKIHKYAGYSALKSLKNVSGNKLTKAVKYITYPIFKMIGWKHWCKKFDKFVRKIDYDKYPHLMAYSGINFKKNIIPKAFFDNLIDVEFEGTQFKAIKEYHTYLTQLYGDYMVLPPKEKQVCHHDLIIFEK